MLLVESVISQSNILHHCAKHLVVYVYIYKMFENTKLCICLLGFSLTVLLSCLMLYCEKLCLSYPSIFSVISPDYTFLFFLCGESEICLWTVEEEWSNGD